MKITEIHPKYFALPILAFVILLSFWFDDLWKEYPAVFGVGFAVLWVLLIFVWAPRYSKNKEYRKSVAESKAIGVVYKKHPEFRKKWIRAVSVFVAIIIIIDSAIAWKFGSLSDYWAYDIRFLIAVFVIYWSRLMQKYPETQEYATRLEQSTRRYSKKYIKILIWGRIIALIILLVGVFIILNKIKEIGQI